MQINKNLKRPRAFQWIWIANLRIYEHIRYENYDFMSQKWGKNKSNVRFVESRFGQKVQSTFPIAQYRIASPFKIPLVTPLLFVYKKQIQIVLFLSQAYINNKQNEIIVSINRNGLLSKKITFKILNGYDRFQ